MNSINIVYASDQRYFPGMLVTLVSMLINSSHNGMHRIHVLDGGISDEKWQSLDKSLNALGREVTIYRYFPDTYDFGDFPAFFYDSKMPYARLLIPKLIQEDKVIYMDSDILFFKDINELWHIPMLGKSALVALEASIPSLKDDCPRWQTLGFSPGEPNFNSGLIVMDLKKFRDKGIHLKAIQYLNDYPGDCRFWDQSALNVALYDDFNLLDQSWNTQNHRQVFKIEDRLEDLLSMQVNYHFVTSFKPWIKYNESPASLFFYKLLEEMNFKLNSDEYINSKRAYLRRMEFASSLSYFFRIRSLLFRVMGRKLRAQNDIKTAKFWKEYLPVVRFEKSKPVQYQLRKSFECWKEKIRDAKAKNEPVIT